MSTTPRTDKEEFRTFGGNIVYSDFARQLERENARLREALKSAVKIIKIWHYLDGSDQAWQIYYDNAPEMQPIRALLDELEAKP